MIIINTRAITGAARLAATAGAILLMGWGCSSSSTPPAADSLARRPDALAASDAGIDQGKQAPGEWSFVPDTPGPGPAVSLALSSIDGARASLELVASGITKVQGVAFRLRFDPARLSIDKVEAGAAWAQGGTVAAKFKARPEGELWGGVGYVGSRGLSASDAVVLARMQLKLPADGTEEIPLGFVASRSLVVDPGLAKLEAEWVGGVFRRDTEGQ